MRSAIALLLFVLFAKSFLAAQSTHFTREAVLEDLSLLYETLLCNHPNLFVYSTKPLFDSTMEKTIGQVQDQTDALTAFNLISGLSAVIKDGHTVFYPNANQVEQNNRTKKFFPYRLFWDGIGLYVHENYGTDKRIPEGSQLLSINGTPADSLIGFLVQKLMHDGEKHQFSHWVINTYFYEFYSYYYGNPEVFTLHCTSPTGMENTFEIHGLPKDILLANKRRLGMQNRAEKAIFVDFADSGRIAILTIRDWHKDVLKKTYHQNFRKEINRAFDKMARQNTQHLIIDLRDNQGGQLGYSRLLLSKLMHEPFRMVSSYKRVKKGHCSDIDNRLVKARGPMSGIHKPHKKPFQGNVCILTNGGSFSNTSIFCTVLQTHQRATFIGEETGGSAFVLCGDITYRTLPNTGIRVEIPTLQFMLQPFEAGILSGVKPDVEVLPNILDLVARRDKAMEAALEKCRQNAEAQK